MKYIVGYANFWWVSFHLSKHFGWFRNVDFFPFVSNFQNAQNIKRNAVGKLLFPYIFAWRNVSNQSMTMLVEYVTGISMEVLLLPIFYRKGREVQSTHSLANQELVGKPCCIQLPAHAGRMTHLSSWNERCFWDLSFGEAQEGGRCLPGFVQRVMMDSWSRQYNQWVLSLIPEQDGTRAQKASVYPFHL